ncbi:FecR domain-containing protein [Arvimicrobium flavum]|uniref:FecR domain-containing protein n=1 Tax=Arvimicrobium flavum TaxID=3393320 RepID=UPI00237BE563|nr:FecR domain-containing protein [Mesorhizobium shangrilense]
MHEISRSLISAAIASVILFWPNSATSQTAGYGCTMQRASGGTQQVLRCQRGVTIIVENGARYSLLDRDRDSIADGVRLRRKALLLDVSRTLSGSGFVVVTPQAIAAVRGTKWAVDAQARRTSVFVVNGRVDVGRPGTGAGVSLGPGQGVDVEMDAAPLVVKRWPQPRVSALLARFGQ